MGSYDDEYVDDDEYYDDEDEQDEDDESVFSGRPSTNPFSSSGLPGRNRAESASSRRDPKEVAADRSRLFGNRDDGKGGSGESGSGRPSPFGGGSSGSSSRFSSGSSFGGGRSSVPRPGEGDKDKDKDKDSGGSSPRPFSGGARTFGSGGSSSGDAGSGSSSSRFGGGSSSSSSGSSGRPSFSSGSSSGGSSGSSSSRFGGGSGPSSGSGSSGSRFGGGSSSGGDKPDDRSSSSSRPFGSSGSSDDKKDDKKDDKSSGGSRSNFGNRGGSGDKKDDKKKDDKSAGGGGGPLGRFRKSDSGDKGGKSDGKDNKSSGGGSPFQRGKSSGDSGDRKSTGDGGGGVAGAVAGLAGRFRRGGSDDKKGDRSKAPKEKSSGGGPLGRLRGGDKDSRGGGAAASSAPGGSGVSGSRPGQSAFGASKSSTEAPARGKDKQQKEKSGEGRGLFSRLTERLPFGHRVKEARKARTSKTRASKVPRRSEGEGLSLDDKLDIVGVGLMFGALVLFFSSLSGQQGSITGAINTFFSQLLGWGAIAVPFAMVAVGLWLIVRHFGEEPPEVDPVRISGIVMGYLGLLMILMIVETFVNPFYQMATTETFQLVVERTTIANGDGGGWVGAQLYTLLVTNFGEIPAFFAVLGWLVVSIMLTTRTSAAELAIFVISIWRSLRVSLQRRAQQRRAERLALAESRAPSADQDLTVSRPEPEALPAAAQRNALPEPETRDVPIEERGIPIRIGGQMATVGAENGERAAQAGAPPAAPPPGLPQQQPAAAQEEKSSGLLGGLGRVLPFGGKSDSSEEKQDTNGKDKDKDKENGGLLGGLGRVLPFGGKSQPESEAPAASRSDDQKEKERSGRTGAVAAAAGAAVTVGSALTSSESGDGDRRETAASRPTGAERGPSQRPAASSTQDQPAARSSFGSSTAAPSRSPGLPGNPAQPSRPGTGDGDSGDGEKASPFARPFGSGSSGSRPTPFGERSAAQRFSEIKPADTDSIEDEDDGDEEEATAAQGMRPRPFAASGSTLSRPSQFTRPSNAPSFPEDDDLDDDDDFDEDEVDDSDAVARLGSAAPPRPAAPPRFGQPMKRDDADEEADDADAGKPAADKRPAGDSGMSLQERMARLNQIRQGAAAQTPKRDTRPVDDEDEDDDDETAFSTAARAVDPFDRIQPGKPAADKADEQPAASKPADSASRPETDASPFRKPTFTPPAASSAAAASGTSGEKEKTDKPAAASRPEDQRPAVASTPSQPKPQARPEPAINPDDHRPQPAAQQQRPQPQGRKQWRLPDYRTLLSSGSDGEIDRDTLVQRARIIEETLQSFGAPGRVVEINTGPVITQFGVEPDYLEGRGGKKSRVKVSAIAQLDKDLQLALGAKSIRIEAPVPGKGFVGIEVPNEEASLVSLRDVMESRQFQKIAEKSALAIALGQSVDGAPVAADLASMPHLLIAGTTGSGKSVCVNAIIDSLLIRNTPEQVKFIMVDPKRVELTGYNGVPHLVAPVVVELERIVGVLKWVTREMDERYKRFSNAGARNIEDYNLHRPANEPNMPYIVVIIDELADLMMLAPDETERVITRIAALARATGIHLVIATQRPSVDVVTGLIKANFPARIAFAVAGSVDSRVILDQPGAERLLGKGDMLYMSGDSPAPLRLQGVFVSDMEINNINRFWKSQGPDVAQQKPITQLVMEDSPAEERRSVIPRGERFTMTPPPSTSGSSSPQRAFWEETAPSNPDNHSAGYGSTSVDEAGHEDELYEEAVELVRRLNKASVSLLQRRLRIGYTRAARLIDVMEAEGIVGPPTEGSKPREVLPFKK